MLMLMQDVHTPEFSVWQCFQKYWSARKGLML